MPYSARVTKTLPLLVLAALVIVFLMRLGVWQLHRADEKRKMIAADSLLAQEKPIWLKDGGKLPQQYQRVLTEGTFLPQIFLLDNQHHQHQFGFDVLSPLLLSNGEVVLVDRGWVKAPKTQLSVSDIKKLKTMIVFSSSVTLPDGKGAQRVSVEGRVYIPSPNQWVLGPTVEKKDNSIYIIERIETKLLSQILQKKLYPFIIRQNPSKGDGLVRDWPIVSLSPERHLGYAVQWFAMALVLLIIVVVLLIKKKND
jgi:surfeit locus 1 family protein